MLKIEEKNKIIELIKEGKSDYAIENETGNAHKTIKEIRENYYMVLGKQIHEDKLNSKSTINTVGRICDNIELVINSGELEEKSKKEWKKKLEDLRKLMRSEVDERITNEIAKAIEKRDQYWIKVIEQQYVKKEDVTNLENIIQNQRNELINKDDIIKKNQTDYYQNLNYIQNENDTLKKQFYGLNNEFLNVMNNTIYLNNYINYRLDNDLRYGQNELNSKWLILNRQIKDFEKFKTELINLFNDHLLKMFDVNNDLIIREKRVINLERSLNI